MLPLESKIIHVRWSGEGGWIPWATSTSGIGPENATSYPSPGELILYPGGVSETELLLAYGYVAFASKAGALAGNHFATVVEGEREPARARPADALGGRAGHLLHARPDVEQRLSLVTLGVADLERATRFYEALGWTTGAAPDDDVVFFQAGGMIVALWDRGSSPRTASSTDSGGWGGITLAHNVRSPAEVDAVIAEAEAAGRHDRPRRSGDVLGRLLGRLRRPRRPSVGGRAQPALDDRRGRRDAALGREPRERGRQHVDGEARCPRRRRARPASG